MVCASAAPDKPTIAVAAIAAVNRLVFIANFLRGVIVRKQPEVPKNVPRRAVPSARREFFFSESLQTDSGEEVSTREVKKILSDLIEAESKKHPLSDERLTELLQEKGYNIARRTVAKYREQLNVPVARLRKEL